MFMHNTKTLVRLDFVERSQEVVSLSMREVASMLPCMRCWFSLLMEGVDQARQCVFEDSFVLIICVCVRVLLRYSLHSLPSGSFYVGHDPRIWS